MDNGSQASSTASSPRISPVARLRHARRVHEQLQQRQWSTSSNSVREVEINNKEEEEDVPYRPPQPPVEAKRRAAAHSGVESLAAELLRLQGHTDNQDDATSLLQRVEKIGSHEKDGLVIHLLQQIAALKTQRNDVAAVGEQLTTRLVTQQHELRNQFKQQIAQLQAQLQHVTTHHPEVEKLQDKVAALEETTRDCEQKLLLAMQRLHRSRQRERALRRESEDGGHPLLWDL